MAGVDVEPDVVLVQDRSQCVEEVDLHAARVTGVCHACEDLVALIVLLVDDAPECALVHAELVVDGHAHDVVLAQRQPRMAERIE